MTSDTTIVIVVSPSLLFSDSSVSLSLPIIFGHYGYVLRFPVCQFGIDPGKC